MADARRTKKAMPAQPASQRPSPTWLSERRQESLARSEGFALPTGREEAWRYTDVSLLEEQIYDGRPRSPGGVPDAARAHLWRWSAEPAHAVLVDGVPVTLAPSPEAKRAHVTLTHLDAAATTHPALLRQTLGALVGAEDLFTARSLALYHGGLLVHVPQGVRLSEPLLLQHWVATAGRLVRPRLVLVVDPGAEVTLVEDLASGALATPTLVTPVTELFLGAGALVAYHSWQQLDAGARHLAHVSARLAEDARLTTFHGTFGASFSRTNLTVGHAGPGSESTLGAVYFPTGDQHTEHWTVQRLDAPHARSELLYKGALGDRAHSVYYGTIRVAPDGRGTESRQTNRNLLLSKQARADSNPQLEIGTNDVRCSHGSSVGQVQADQLHYAMSRGIPRPEAERLLVTGFLAEVADRVGGGGRKGAALRERVERLVAEKLGDLPAGETP